MTIDTIHWYAYYPDFPDTNQVSRFPSPEKRLLVLIYFKITAYSGDLKYVFLRNFYIQTSNNSFVSLTELTY